MPTHVLATGQRFCADKHGHSLPCAGSGQDAESSTGLPWPEPRFRADELTVLDRLTGLTWLRDANVLEFPLDWETARSEIDTLNQRTLAGHHDWRLPGRRELFSLISFQDARPALAQGHPFQNVFQGWYWTSDISAMHPANAWHVHMEGGRMFWGTRTGFELVWPVRGTSSVLPDPSATPTGFGASWPAPRFEERGGAILDRLTGLVWTRSADLTPGPVAWKKALAVVERTNQSKLHAISSWRLPTITELESLADISRHSPALPQGHPFTDTREAYWSSTNSAFEPDWAMCFYLHKGAVGVGFKPDKGFHVWCVSLDNP